MINHYVNAMFLKYMLREFSLKIKTSEYFFALTDGGPHFRVCAAHARPSTWPPMDMSRNYLAHMSANPPLNVSPNPSEVISEVLETLDNF